MRSDDDHYCVHVYDNHLTVHVESDDDEAGRGDQHRRLDSDEYRAFVHDFVAVAIHDNPAIVLDAIDDDHDFLRALDNRRRANDHIDFDPDP